MDMSRLGFKEENCIKMLAKWQNSHCDLHLKQHREKDQACVLFSGKTSRNNKFWNEGFESSNDRITKIHKLEKHRYLPEDSNYFTS